MNKKRSVFDVQLDEEERELLESIERGEWKSVDNTESKDSILNCETIE